MSSPEKAAELEPLSRRDGGDPEPQFDESRR